MTVLFIRGAYPTLQPQGGEADIKRAEPVGIDHDPRGIASRSPPTPV
jgi:hypothetical protein